MEIKDFNTKLWQKVISDFFEEDIRIYKTLNNIQMQERMKKERTEIKRILEDIDNKNLEQIAQLIYCLENKIKEKDKYIQSIKKELSAIEKIRDIIIDTYNYDED